MKKQLFSALLASVCFAAAAPVFAQNLAVVNGESIPQDRYDFFIEQFKQAGQEITPEMEQHVKEELIRRAVFEQEAARHSLEDSRAFTEEMALARQTFLIRGLFLKYQEDNPITEDAIKAGYDEFLAANPAGPEYLSAHILVETEEEANGIIAELKEDASQFATIAQEKSLDPGSGSQGGDLGWQTADTYVPEFAEALTKLEKGAITQAPVQTQFGWHVLKLEDTREAAAPPTLDAMRPQIEQVLAERQLVEYQQELFSKAEIER